MNLDLNINVAKARTLLGLTASSSNVDSSILLEDDGFCTLLTSLVNGDKPWTVCVESLSSYVQDNY